MDSKGQKRKEAPESPSAPHVKSKSKSTTLFDDEHETDDTGFRLRF